MSASISHQSQPTLPIFPFLKRQIKHKRKDYDLRVTFNQQQNNSFEISLKVYANVEIMKYSCKFDNDNVPNDLKQTFSSLEILFEFFSEEKDFSVNILKGQIVVKGQFQIGIRKVQRQCLIKLERVQLKQVENLLQTLENLEEEIIEIKQKRNKQPMQMKDEYQEKFQHEKRRLEQALKVRLDEEEKYKSKQAQLQRQIDSLKSDFGQIAKQVTMYVKDNGKKLEDLKRKSHGMEVLITEYQQNYEELLVFIKGSKGRKMQRPKESLQARRQINKIKFKAIQEQKNEDKMIQVQVSKTFDLLDRKFGRKDFDSILDMQSSGFNRFRVQGKTITLKIEDERQSRLWMKVPISLHQQIFEIKILKSKANKIWIGIMSKNQKQNKIQNTLVYGGQAKFWSQTKIIGKGFKQGDSVKVITNLSNGTIQWKVNGKIQASNNILSCNNSELFPCIFMEDYGDSVVWIGEIGNSG